MIENFEDLNFDDIYKQEDVEGPVQPISPEEQANIFRSKIDNILQEKLGVTIGGLKQLLSDYLVSHAEELTHEFVNVVPFGDYSKLLEDNDSMADFFKTEAHKVEHWKLQGLTQVEGHNGLINFHFVNSSVDDGDVMTGYVYVSFQGKIKHAFVQGNDN